MNNLNKIEDAMGVVVLVRAEAPYYTFSWTERERTRTNLTQLYINRVSGSSVDVSLKD